MADFNRPPTDGRGLYAWAMKQQETHGVAMVYYLKRWGIHRGWRPWISDWTADQVAEAYEAASTALAKYLK